MRGSNTALKIVVWFLVAFLIFGAGFAGGWYFGDQAGYQKGYQQGSSDMKAVYEKVVSDLKASHEKAIADLKASHEKAIAALKDDLKTYYEKALADLKAKYEKEIVDLKAAHEEALDKAKKESYGKGYKKGYQDGQSLASVQDPTYAEMQRFLQQDKTGKPSNLNVVYNNPLFANTVNTNAENQDIRCAVVFIQFTGGKWHMIVAFQTTDQGLIYVEPQNDHEVTLQVDESYSQQNGFKPKSGDVIQDFIVIW